MELCVLRHVNETLNGNEVFLLHAYLNFNLSPIKLDFQKIQILLLNYIHTNVMDISVKDTPDVSLNIYLSICCN